MKHSISEAVRAWFLTPILEELKNMEAKMSALSDAIADLSAKTDALEAVLTKSSADLTAEIQQIADKIAAGGVSQADLDGLKALSGRLATAATSLSTLDTNITNIIP